MRTYYSEKRGKKPFAEKHAAQLSSYDLSDKAFDEAIHYKGEYNSESPRWWVGLERMCFEAIDKPNQVNYYYFEENGYEYQYSFHFNDKNRVLTTNYWLRVSIPSWKAQTEKG
jgi:hypothetical protein